MVRKRFEAAFERLREQSNTMAKIDRSPENYDEIVEQGAELARLRNEANDERKKIVSRYEPPARDGKDEPRPQQASTNRTGKVAAVIATIVMVGGLIAIVVAVQDATRGFPLTVENITETIDPDNRCRWTVQATVRNDSETETVTITRVRTIVSQGFASLWLREPPTLAPGDSATVEASWALLKEDPCPAVDEIGHGDLTFFFENGATVARGF